MNGTAGRQNHTKKPVSYLSHTLRYEPGSLAAFSCLNYVQPAYPSSRWIRMQSPAPTAVCALVFTLFHFPCGTTCFTIYKETKSLKWTAAAVALPTAVGAGLCILIHLLLG